MRGAVNYSALLDFVFQFGPHGAEFVQVLQGLADFVGAHGVTFLSFGGLSALLTLSL